MYKRHKFNKLIGISTRQPILVTILTTHTILMKTWVKNNLLTSSFDVLCIFKLNISMIKYSDKRHQGRTHRGRRRYLRYQQQTSAGLDRERSGFRNEKWSARTDQTGEATTGWLAVISPVFPKEVDEHPDCKLFRRFQLDLIILVILINRKISKLYRLTFPRQYISVSGTNRFVVVIDKSEQRLSILKRLKHSLSSNLN